jgi:hypothetical protein
MRKVIITALAAGAALAATPAAAQGWGFQNYHQGYGQAHARQIAQQINQLGNRIGLAQQRRTISPREANGLRNQLSQLQRQHRQFARNGLDRREVAVLQSGVNRIQQLLRLERRDADRRRF